MTLRQFLEQELGLIVDEADYIRLGHVNVSGKLFDTAATAIDYTMVISRDDKIIELEQDVEFKHRERQIAFNL